MAVKGTLVLASLALLAGVTSGQAGQRNKRSDDPSGWESVVEGLSQQMTQVTAQLTTLQTQLNAVQNTVAFHARHSADPFSVASHGTLVYDTVGTNIGKAYDARTGLFTAPVSGTYVFFVNCMAVDSTSEETYVMVEGHSVAGCYSWKPNGSAPHEQGATMATVHVQSGQQVWVQLSENAENVRGSLWNTFSGFLLQADA